MAEVLETTRVAITHGEDSDEAFQKDAESVSEEFLNLFFKDSKLLIGKGLKRRKESEAVDTSPEQIAFEYVPEQSTVDKPVYRHVAERLQKMGDHFQFDNSLLSAQSVFNIGQGEFTKLCECVLIRSNSTMRSGWQQVHAVYHCLARVIQELRQYDLSELARRQREAVLVGFVVPVLRELGLDDWIARNGGLREVPSEADTKVHIVRSSV